MGWAGGGGWGRVPPLQASLPIPLPDSENSRAFVHFSQVAVITGLVKTKVKR